MNILVTGAKGFIGKNLVIELKNRGYNNIIEFDINNSMQELESYCQNVDFVFHLAGVNRPTNDSDFKIGNYDLTTTLVSYLEKYNNLCPITVSSSTQAELDNLYGLSKKNAEDFLFNKYKNNLNRLNIFRFPNVFGKWCKPNYNSVIATFCYNISRDLPITINDENKVLNLVYIDDVIEALIDTINCKVIKNKFGFCEVSKVYSKTLLEIANLIKGFKNIKVSLSLPKVSDEFISKLYATYLSHLPTSNFISDLKMNIDNRGSFTELFRTLDNGQISVNITKPGITKGNHWHHTKNEKFIVVSGRACIKLRNILDSNIIEIEVSGDNIKVVDIPIGYTHSIKNIGDEDLVIIMWASECFNKDKPDTYFLEV